jgi:deazaflavin-dependent oxidoreductase (nitroreductase family)
MGGMAYRRGLALFNKRVTNRVQGLWAPFVPPWTVIVHKGRKSGREYQTPVLAARSGRRLQVVLFYGDEADWVRNVVAAGGAGVRRARRTYTLTGARVVGADDPAVSPMLRRLVPGRMRVLVGDLSD